MDSTESLLVRRLSELDESIAFLTRERAKVEKILSELKKENPEIFHYEKLHFNSLRPFSNERPPEFLQYKFALPAFPKEPTFKEKVVTGLSEEYPQGASANELLNYMNRRWLRPVVRTSLSPQLSRLKHENVVDLINGKWVLKQPPLIRNDATSVFD